MLVMVKNEVVAHDCFTKAADNGEFHFIVSKNVISSKIF
jgi:hypothetical protein